MEWFASTVGLGAARVKRALALFATRPYAHGVTETLESAITSLVGAAREISDPIECYEATKAIRVRIDREMKELAAEMARNLHEGRSWKEVGDLLGVTGARAEQISRAAR